MTMTIIAWAMIIVFLALVMMKKMQPFTALLLVPLVFTLGGAFLGQYTDEVATVIMQDDYEDIYDAYNALESTNPEDYAVKNWIVSAQGFLISCATFGFTSNYDSIMEGSFEKDLFYGTFGEKLMDLLGDMAYRRVFTSRAIYRMEVHESTILKF